MYVDQLKNGTIAVEYVSAHTGHDLGPEEIKHLPLPKSIKNDVSMKISLGIPSQRILQGRYT